MIPEFGRSIREALGLSEGLPAYFAMLMLGFLVAVGTGVVWAKRSKLDKDVIIDMGLASLIAGVAGARIMHVLVDGYFMNYVNLCVDPTAVHWQITQAECGQVDGGVWNAITQRCDMVEGDCFAWAKFWSGGLVWYGGLLFAAPYDIWFMRKEGFPVLKGLDMAGMMIPLGVFFGRLGCWFGGCCYGLRSDDWGVSFPPWSPASHAQWQAGELGTPAHDSFPVLPTQLYEAGALLAIAAICMFVVHPRKRFDGQVFCISMIAYSAARFGLEYLRDDERGAFLWFSTSQWIGLGIIAAAIGFWVWLARRAREKASAPMDEKALAAV